MGAEFGYRLHTGPNGELAIVSQHQRNTVVLCSAYTTTGLNFTQENGFVGAFADQFPRQYPVRQYVDLHIRSRGRVQFLNELPPHFTNPLASFTTEALLAEIYDRMEQRRIALSMPSLPSSTSLSNLS